MSHTFFITGTDTEIGKTWCTLALMHVFQQQNHTVIGMKPIASGCELTNEGLRNDDALQIQQQSSFSVDYALVNPYHFEPPIAPHLAAQLRQQTITLPPILEAYQQLAKKAEIMIVEGVGGWYIPINDTAYLKDLVQMLRAKVILVVGLRLGCINHALLTVDNILQQHCELSGWIANPIDPTFSAQDSINTLQQRIAAPLLGIMPYLEKQNVTQLAQVLNIDALIA